MKSLKDILNEDSAAEIQADEAPGQGDSKNLIPLKAGKFTRKSLIRTMRKPEGYIQTSDGQQYSIAHPIDQSDMWGDKSIFGIDQDGGEVEINYNDITSYSETYDEDDGMTVRSMTYDDAHMPKTKIDILTAMKRELRGMKVADLKASYQYIKAAHCNTKEGMQGIGTKKDMLTAMMKDLRGMKRDALAASYGYIKSAHCGPREAAHEPEEINASSCTSESVDLDLSEAIDFSKVTDKNLISWVTKFRTVKGMPWNDFKQDMAAAEKEVKKRKLKIESVDLEEMKTKDDDLAVMIYDFIGADTEGLPLKTLIHQAVGKYFGSQKEKKK